MDGASLLDTARFSRRSLARSTQVLRRTRHLNFRSPPYISTLLQKISRQAAQRAENCAHCAASPYSRSSDRCVLGLDPAAVLNANGLKTSSRRMSVQTRASRGQTLMPVDTDWLLYWPDGGHDVDVVLGGWDGKPSPW